MKNFNINLFFSLMILGILITLNSSSWITAWLGLELNMLGFLPLLMDENNMMSYESIMKYFLISGVSSMMLLYFSMYNLNFAMYSINTNQTMILLALGLKLGAAPFHSWFISFLGNLKPWIGYLFMTLQKLPIFFLISMNMDFFLFIIFILFSMIIGTVGGFHQTNLMKILAYSSITHVAWILVGILNMNKIWSIYFIIYSVGLFPIIFIISQYKVFYLSKIMNKMNYPIYALCFLLISLSGFPPLLGFFPKLFILMSLFNTNMFLLALALIFSSIVNLYYYMRLFYSSLFMYTQSYGFMNIYNSFLWVSIMIIMMPLLIIYM